MRNKVYRLFLILILLLFWIQIFPSLAILGQKPDLLLILTLFVSQKKGVMEGQLTGFFSGLSQDIFCIELFGIHSFTKLIVGYLVGLIHKNFIADRVGFQFILGLIGGLVHGLLYILAKAIFGSIDLAFYIKKSLWINILYTALLTPILFMVLEFFEKRFGEP